MCVRIPRARPHWWAKANRSSERLFENGEREREKSHLLSRGPTVSGLSCLLYLVNDTVSLWCCRGTPSTIMRSVAFLRIFLFFSHSWSSAGLDGWDRRGTGLGLGRRVLILVSYNGRCIKHSRRLCWGLRRITSTENLKSYKMMGIWGQVTDKRTPPLCLIPSVIHF